jgi:hypothetical protein
LCWRSVFYLSFHFDAQRPTKSHQVADINILGNAIRVTLNV